MKPELSGSHVQDIDVAVVNPLTDSSWDKWIASHPEATVFHTSAWARVLADTYGHRPWYLHLAYGGEPLALVPMMEVRSSFKGARGICLPFSDGVAPLLTDTFGMDRLTKALRRIGRERRWNYFEVRDKSILPGGAQASASYWSHKLDLTKGRAVLSANFSSSARRALRKAEHSGLSAVIRTDVEAMRQFYSLHVRTRRRHGLPPQPRSFFQNIQRCIIDAGLGFIVTAKKAERAVAAAVFFKFGRHAIYKYGASDKRWQEFRPNNLVLAEGINFLAASGSEILHFGRTDKTNEGLRRFKLSWGAEEGEISYGKFAISADNWVPAQTHKSAFHHHIFRALPAPLARLAGVLLYPHLD